MFRKSILLIIMFLLVQLVSSRSEAGWGVGNGGDALRLQFAKAKEHAAFITLRTKKESFSKTFDQTLIKWIIANKEALSGDIIQSQHIWIEDDKPTCAWTYQPEASDPVPIAKPIELSFPTCRKEINNFEEAEILLIHESIHHFAVTDEDFADQVAIAITSAWKEGKTDWIELGTSGQKPPAKAYHSLTWTGENIVVFGGLEQKNGDFESSNSGFIYKPAEKIWTAIAKDGAPARNNHEAVWINGKMIIWGGFYTKSQKSAWQNSGAIWDPKKNSWTQLAIPYASASTSDYVISRKVQTMVASENMVIIWGGIKPDGKPIGGVYFPTENTWKPISSTNAPLRKGGHSAIWTGTKMIIFGGFGANEEKLNAGALYDPKLNTWEEISNKNAPTFGEEQTAVWTGEKMIVFGGYEPSFDMVAKGGIFDPKKNEWTSISNEIAISRTGHSAIWTGKEMLIFGGKAKRSTSYFSTVIAYDPISDQWRSVSSKNKPLGRSNQGAVWTGSSLVVWGGYTGSQSITDTGAVFYP